MIRSKKIFSLSIAFFLILGSIFASGFTFGEENILPSVEEESLELEFSLMANPGSFHTTDSSGKKKEHFDHKEDVYFKVSNFSGYHQIVVSAPQGDHLGTGYATLTNGGNHHLWSIVNYAATTNEGGNYQIFINRQVRGKKGWQNVSHHTFKVQKSKPVDPILGSIIINKIVHGLDEGENPLFNFNLAGPEDREFNLSNGQYDTLSNLPLGTYTLTEVLPEGYENDLPENGREIELTENEPTAVIVVNNTKLPPIDPDPEPKPWKGHIKVIKTKIGGKGKFGFPILEDPRDIVFTLEDEDGEIYTATTNRFGIAIFSNLPEGNYILKEEIPEGYKNNLPADGQLIVLNKSIVKRLKNIIPVINTKIKEDPHPADPELGSITVLKFAIDEMENPISKAGFTFRLIKLGEEGGIAPRSINNEIESQTTGEEGILVFGDLEPGEYLLLEEPVDGFESSIPEGMLITLDEEMMDPEVEVMNIKLDEEEPPGNNDDDPPGNNDDDPPGNEDPPPTTVDDDPPSQTVDPIDDEEEIVTIEEDVPEAPVEVEEDNEDETLDEVVLISEEEEVEIEEDVPEAAAEVKEEKQVPTLPKTGAATPFVSMGLGTILLGIGEYLRRRR